MGIFCELFGTSHLNYMRNFFVAGSIEGQCSIKREQQLLSLTLLGNPHRSPSSPSYADYSFFSYFSKPFLSLTIQTSLLSLHAPLADLGRHPTLQLASNYFTTSLLPLKNSSRILLVSFSPSSFSKYWGGCATIVMFSEEGSSHSHASRWFSDSSEIISMYVCTIAPAFGK